MSNAMLCCGITWRSMIWHGICWFHDVSCWKCLIWYNMHHVKIKSSNLHNYVAMTQWKIKERKWNIAQHHGISLSNTTNKYDSYDHRPKISVELSLWVTSTFTNDACNDNQSQLPTRWWLSIRCWDVLRFKLLCCTCSSTVSSYKHCLPTNCSDCCVHEFHTPEPNKISTSWTEQAYKKTRQRLPHSAGGLSKWVNILYAKSIVSEILDSFRLRHEMWFLRIIKPSLPRFPPRFMKTRNSSSSIAPGQQNLVNQPANYWWCKMQNLVVQLPGWLTSSLQVQFTWFQNMFEDDFTAWCFSHQESDHQLIIVGKLTRRWCSSAGLQLNPSIHCFDCMWPSCHCCWFTVPNAFIHLVNE